MIAKIIVSLILLISFQSIVLADYVVNEQDRSILIALGDVPEKGMEYVRCERKKCYVIRTGEFMGSQPDGIYMVWVNEPPPTSIE